MINYIEGDLINLALQGEFDVIAHGCNCFCTMGAGIAPQMAKAFGCDEYLMESFDYKGDITKLGQIDSESFTLAVKETTKEIKLFPGRKVRNEFKGWVNYKTFSVINAYTQFHYGKNHIDGISSPVDYEAITLCMRKINFIFNGKHIGLPKIGCGLAGGDWDIVSGIIKRELIDCRITIVNYRKHA